MRGIKDDVIEKAPFEKTFLLHVEEGTVLSLL